MGEAAAEGRNDHSGMKTLARQVNAKSAVAAATKLAFVTPTTVIESSLSRLITVSLPTCVMSFESAMKLPQSLAANDRFHASILCQR